MSYMKHLFIFVFGLMVLMKPAFGYAQTADNNEGDVLDLVVELLGWALGADEGDPDSYEEYQEWLKEQPKSEPNKKLEESVFNGFRVLFGVGYEGYFVSKRHTFDFDLFMEYDWDYFGLSLNLDCGLSRGSSVPTFLVNLNTQFVYPVESDFILSAGIGPGMAYLDKVFFSVRISAGIYKAFDNIIIGGSINYIPMFNFKDEYDHAFGLMIHIGHG